MNPAPNILDKIPQLEPDIPVDGFAQAVFTQHLLWGGLAALVVLGLAAWLVVRIIRKRRSAQTTPPPTHAQVALAAISRVEEDMPAIRECSLRLSLILRTFLEGQAHDSSLYETHEEFTQRMDSLSGVPLSCQNATRDLFDDLVRYKYAGNAEGSQALVGELAQRARELVNNIACEQERLAAETQQNGKETAA